MNTKLELVDRLDSCVCLDGMYVKDLDRYVWDHYHTCPVCGKGQVDQDDPKWVDEFEMHVMHYCPDGHKWCEVYDLDRVIVVADND